METVITGGYEFRLELRRRPDESNVPIYVETVTEDVNDLISETYISGVLSEQLPCEADQVEADVRPVWRREPLVEQVEVTLVARHGDERSTYLRRFESGRWARRSQLAVARLREEGTLANDDVAYRSLVGTTNGHKSRLTPPLLEPPPIVDQTLEELGVRGLGAGGLVPDRPVLVNARMVADIVRLTEAAGATETGGAVLGKLVRLPRPLPDTETRVVTILSASVLDERHVGAAMTFSFSPEALTAAAQLAELRGAGECVITAWHSHGWGCGECNQKECPLAECTLVSAADYQVVESLFSSKASVMPIAGRRRGDEGRKPVLEIHAWRGGEMRPIRWQCYED